MADAFVVCGESGEYSGWAHWVVRVLPSEADALAFVKAAEAYVKAAPFPFPPFAEPGQPGHAEYKEAMRAFAKRHAARKRYFAVNPYDTKMDDTVTYSIEQVPMGALAPTASNRA